MPRGTIDPAARNVTLAVAAGRISIGVGALFATRPALRALGFPEPDLQARVLGKLAGGRDIALGSLTMLGRDNPAALRTATLTGAGVDAVDAISLGLAAVHGEEMSPAVALGALSGGVAAALGIWAARRI
jgi:hypothetical protein